jgi:hypothetical protein
VPLHLSVAALLLGTGLVLLRLTRTRRRFAHRG